MELETGVQVSTNQVTRQEEENKRLQESLEASHAEVKRLHAALTEQKRKFGDLESQARQLLGRKICYICKIFKLDSLLDYN